MEVYVIFSIFAHIVPKGLNMKDRTKDGRFKKGRVSSHRSTPIVGTQYGEYTVIDETVQKTKDSKIMFHVRCSCGLEHYVRAYFLKSGRQLSCKSCSQRRGLYKVFENGGSKFTDNWTHKGIGDVTLSYFNHFRYGAERRNILFSEDITPKLVWELFLKQNKKCALSGVDITLSTDFKNCQPDYNKISASLDRIDSNKGYEIGNIQWVHKDINKMKHKFEQNYFIEMCKKVTTNHANTEPSQTGSCLEGAETSGSDTNLSGNTINSVQQPWINYEEWKFEKEWKENHPLAHPFSFKG